MATPIQLGQAANLLFGYRQVWDPNGPELPFFAPPTAPVATTQPAYVPAEYPYWDATPTITLHETAESLVSAIYQYRVAPLPFNPPGLKVPTGPLTLGDADSAAAVADVGKLLGLDLTAGLSYMLVTLRRVDGTATHPFVSRPLDIERGSYLTAQAKAVIALLKPAQAPQQGSVLYDSKITKPDADQYVEAIYQLGTHFVSIISAGDMLLQVFAYAPKQFALMRKNFEQDATLQPDGTWAVTGQPASAWAFYTSELNEPYGYVTGYGQLLCLSRDPALVLANWTNPNQYVPASTPSIFAGAKNYKLMSPLTKSVPIGLSLTPVAALIAVLQVAEPWDGLVKGGLLQKYGAGVTVPLSRKLNLNWDEIFPDDEASYASNIVTPKIDIYQDRVDLAKVKLQGAALLVKNSITMQSFMSFSQIMEATTQPGDDPIELPSDKVTLVAHIIDMTQAAQTPVLKMSLRTAKLEGGVRGDVWIVDLPSGR